MGLWIGHSAPHKIKRRKPRVSHLICFEPYYKSHYCQCKGCVLVAGCHFKPPSKNHKIAGLQLKQICYCVKYSRYNMNLTTGHLGGPNGSLKHRMSRPVNINHCFILTAAQPNCFKPMGFHQMGLRASISDMPWKGLRERASVQWLSPFCQQRV